MPEYFFVDLIRRELVVFAHIVCFQYKQRTGDCFESHALYAIVVNRRLC